MMLLKSILKDAAASAIYGVRAANGVILITTKKWQSELLTTHSSLDHLNCIVSWALE